MWDSPHEGIAVINLLGKSWRMRFDWAALSRLEFRYGGKEDLNNPVHLAEVAAEGLEAFHPGELTGKDIMSARLPVVKLGERVKAALSYSVGSHPFLVQKVTAKTDLPKVEPPKGADRFTRAYKTALKIGIDPEQFWRLTPYQTSLRVDVFNESHQQRVKDELWKAWHTGLFSREDHKLPKYEKLFPPSRPNIPENETPRERGIRLREQLMRATRPTGLRTDA